MSFSPLRASPMDPVKGEELNRVQDRLKAAFDALSALYLPTVALVTGVALSNTADTLVSHGLGAPPRGYLVVRASAAASVHDGTTASTDPRSTISLRSSAAGTFSLLFF